MTDQDYKLIKHALNRGAVRWGPINTLYKNTSSSVITLALQYLSFYARNLSHILYSD